MSTLQSFNLQIYIYCFIICVIADETQNTCTNSLTFRATELAKIILDQHDIIERLNATLEEQNTRIINLEGLLTSQVSFIKRVILGLQWVSKFR